MALVRREVGRPAGEEHSLAAGKHLRKQRRLAGFDWDEQFWRPAAFRDSPDTESAVAKHNPVRTPAEAKRSQLKSTERHRCASGTRNLLDCAVIREECDPSPVGRKHRGIVEVGIDPSEYRGLEVGHPPEIQPVVGGVHEIGTVRRDVDVAAVDGDEPLTLWKCECKSRHSGRRGQRPERASDQSGHHDGPNCGRRDRNGAAPHRHAHRCERYCTCARGV
jgi:hypothetical protein